MYVSHSLFIVNHAADMSAWLAYTFLIVGYLCVYINYDADRQRALVRRTDGKCLIWGKPPSVIRATYVTERGETKESLLLCSGWWGVSRHFHYVPEILAALCWALPGGFTHFMPYFYVCFLTVLLADRAFRDDKRCSDKYGKFYAEYCRRVPYKIIPGLV